MEPQITQITQMDTGEGRVNLLFKRITGCTLTVVARVSQGWIAGLTALLEVKRVVPDP
jgi:hypothetical protein